MVFEIAEVVVEADKVERWTITKSGDGLGSGVDVQRRNTTQDPVEFAVAIGIVIEDEHTGHDGRSLAGCFDFVYSLIRGLIRHVPSRS